MPKFIDLGDETENARIKAIGDAVTLARKTVAFVVDDTPGKADRYITKLLNRYPTVIIVDRLNGPVAGSITVKVRPGA